MVRNWQTLSHFIQSGRCCYLLHNVDERIEARTRYVSYRKSHKCSTRGPWACLALEQLWEMARIWKATAQRSSLPGGWGGTGGGIVGVRERRASPESCVLHILIGFLELFFLPFKSQDRSSRTQSRGRASQYEAQLASGGNSCLSKWCPNFEVKKKKSPGGILKMQILTFFLQRDGLYRHRPGNLPSQQDRPGSSNACGPHSMRSQHQHHLLALSLNCRPRGTCQEKLNGFLQMGVAILRSKERIRLSSTLLSC